MSNLLLESTKLKVLWQRRIRLVVAISIAMISVLSMVYIALLPVTVYTYLVTQDVPTVSLDAKQGKTLGEQRRDAKVQLEKYKRFINGIKLVYTQSGVLPEINNIINDIDNLGSIELTRVDVTYENGSHIIYIVGVAPDRASVVSLQSVLAERESMELVDFPISNFAIRDGVYNFTVELRLSKKDKHE